MSKSVRKVFATAVIAALAMGIAAPAQAQTVSELNALIAKLQADIAVLMAQISGLGGSTGGGVTGIPAGFTFGQNLAQGSSNLDVMYLQMFLNNDPATQLASSGAGSPGSETQFFGPITRSGVIKFQNKYAAEVLAPVGLTAGTGFFGPSSRAKANSMLAAAPPVVPTPTPGPGATPVPTPGPGISTPGAEGSLIVTANSNPASGAVLNTGEIEDVTGIDIKATGSDVIVDRLDLEFDTRPWLYISEMTVSDGTTSKTISITEANTTEVTVGTKYSVRVNGLNILVPKDTTKKITVTVTAVTGLPVGTTTKNIVLTFIANSIRGTDGADLTQTAPTASIATRTITVQEPSTADLELTAHSSNPKARAVLVNSTAETTGVVLAVFNLKAKNNDVILRSVEVEDTDSVATSASNTPKVLYLYDGTTLLSSTSSLAAASATLDTINLLIKKDTTVTLTLKADLRKASGNYAEGATSSITIGLEASSINAEDATSFAAATVSGSAVTVGTAYFYVKAPEIKLVSTPTIADAGGLPSGSSGPQSLAGSLVFSVKALGGDIYLPIYSATTASNGLQGTSAAHVATTTVTQTFNSSADFGSSANDTYVIRSGQTETFTLTATVTTCGAADPDEKHFNGVNLDWLKWGTTQADTYTSTAVKNTWTWGLTAFKTPTLELLPCQ